MAEGAREDRRPGELVVRPEEHTVYVDDREVPLTEREYEIVVMLAEHPGWVCTPGQLAEPSYEDECSPESITVLVSRLRHKLADAGVGEIVQTVRGVGYRLHVDAHGTHGESQPEAGAELQAMRDAAWSLNEEVVRLEQAGPPDQLGAATRILIRARDDIVALARRALQG